MKTKVNSKPVWIRFQKEIYLDRLFLLQIRNGGKISGKRRGTAVGRYAGAMLNFFPFIGDDLTIKAIGFCTLIICTVVAVCTHFIMEKMDKK